MSDAMFTPKDVCPTCGTENPKRCLDCKCCLVCALKQQKPTEGEVCCLECEQYYLRGDN